MLGALKVPVMLCQADNDPFDSIKALLDTKPFAKECVVKHFKGQVRQ